MGDDLTTSRGRGRRNTFTEPEHTLKELLDKLLVGSFDDKCVNLKHILAKLKNDPSSLPSVLSSNLISSIAKMLQEHKQLVSSLPDWFKQLISTVYFNIQLEIPKDQTIELVKVLTEYLNIHLSEASIQVIRSIAKHKGIKLLLLDDSPFYSAVRKHVFCEDFATQTAGLQLLYTLASNCPEWQAKMLHDKELIENLLQNPSCPELWNLLATVAHHSDAKELIPKSVLAKAFKTEGCADVCALLCDEKLTPEILSVEYIEKREKQLEHMLELRHKLHEQFSYTLLDLILPLVNLSVADANKALLGKHVLRSLLLVVTIERDPPLIDSIGECLDQAKIKATKAIWNLAFNEANRKKIFDVGGLDKLKAAHKRATDEHLKRNICGILYMFHEVKEEVKPILPGQRHVMISYNWANQPTIIRLAQSLKENDYKVWLDIEQMNGSTLGAMADAVERADVVLMCMSQKYKDSPNCRLEGEYCIQRKVTFIPLMMQQGYAPDGWLGIALGSKLYYEFHAEDEWDTKIKALVKGIGSLGKINGDSDSPSSLPTQLPVQVPKSACHWTDEDMLAWTKAERIEDYYEVLKKHKFDGRALLEVKAILNSPQSVLPFLFEKLGIIDVGELFRITSAIRKLN